MLTGLNKSVNLAGVFHDVWCKLLQELLDYGSRTSPRGKETTEIIGVQLCMPRFADNILISPKRNLNYKFMVAEWLWIHEGFCDLKSILPFNSRYKEFSDDGNTLFGAYGPVWLSQRDYLLKTLRSDSSTRQAVMTLWRPNPPKSRDIPCTLSFQFFIRDEHLDVIVNMRSSDTWLGLPYDYFTFSQLANWLAVKLEVDRGSMTFQIGSSHLYEEHFQQAQDIIDNPDIGTASSPRLESDYEGKILTAEYPSPVIGLEEPWRTYAEILGRPRSEALANLMVLAS